MIHNKIPLKPNISHRLALQQQGTNVPLNVQISIIEKIKKELNYHYSEFREFNESRRVHIAIWIILLLFWGIDT